MALRRITLRPRGGMQTAAALVLSAALVFCSSGALAAPEEQAVRTFAALREGTGGDPSAQVAQMLGSLDEAGLHNLGTIALAELARSVRPEVRDAARRQLMRRASDSGLALALLLRGPGPDPLPSAMAVKLARAHLERALDVAPPEEGSSFAPMQGRSPEPTPASATDAQAPAPISAAQKLATEELTLSRTLAASVPAGDPREGEAHEISALAALATGDIDAAQASFEAVARMKPEGDEANARHERAVLQLARLAYAKGDDARAQVYYSRVSRAAPEWLDALFESSWSHFREGEDDKALGNLLTLHAPFFQGRFYPESYVLKALVLYENCRYPEARLVLREFEARYRPLHDGLAGALERMPTAQAAVESLSQASAFPVGAREEVARVASAPELKTGLVEVAQMAQELDSIDRRPEAFQKSALSQTAMPRLRAARLDLLQSVGDRLRTRLTMERGELRELLGQALRLDFEIAGREKEQAQAPAGSTAPVAAHRAPPVIDEDEVLWPFEGEYWRDELGSYRYQLGQRCAGPRATVPPKAMPVANPPKLAPDATPPKVETAAKGPLPDAAAKPPSPAAVR